MKNDSISITHNDINQGISYGGYLQDDIVIFTMDTNEHTTRIIDSVSKIELTNQKISEQSFFFGEKEIHNK